MTTLRSLYETLAQRKRPEDVAQMVLRLLPEQLAPAAHALLEKAAAGSLERNLYGYTSMLQDFARAKGAGKQVARAMEIFRIGDAGNADYNNYEDIEAFIRSVAPLIRKATGKNNFKEDRLNKAQRKAAGLDISKRNYNKKWRLLKRLEAKLLTFARESRKVEFQMIAKHGLAHHLDYDNFSKDLNTACFIAYYNAKCNLRSVFTNQSQARPFDDICQLLLDRCREAAATTNWWAIAHIYTSREVLSHLTDEQKGALLGRWTTVLQDIAGMLGEVWHYSNINRATMIVRRGYDSTTWNNTAGAWNKARDNWMNLVYAMGLEHLLENICFGKALRLMAADVAAWHLSSGGALSPDTLVWNKLPLPWEVFEGKAACNREMVASACREAGVDPEKSGWIAPRVHGVAPFTPTPELVHGVMMFNPFLAAVLKDHQYFSGKPARPIFPEKN